MVRFNTSALNPFSYFTSYFFIHFIFKSIGFRQGPSDVLILVLVLGPFTYEDWMVLILGLFTCQDWMVLVLWPFTCQDWMVLVLGPFRCFDEMVDSHSASSAQHCFIFNAIKLATLHAPAQCCHDLV